MIIEQTRLSGVCLVKPELLSDQRGFFARMYCEQEFSRAGLVSRFVQCNISYNAQRGILRGMHYQIAPGEEGKLVRCTKGAIYDVAVDLRPSSPTFCQWVATELNEENRHALYIPPGFAHGFQTLTGESEVFYQMTEFFRPELASGVRWDDPAFGISWPIPNPILSEKDAGHEDFKG